VLGFGSSSALASAYGIAVTLTMLITTVLTFFVVRHAWRYPLPLALAATWLLAAGRAAGGGLRAQVLDGGWFPLVLGLAVHRDGHLAARPRAADGNHAPRRPRAAALHPGAGNRPDLHRVLRTAVYAVANPDTVPQALMHNLKHNQVLHERNLILTVVFHEVPWVPFDQRVQVTPLGRASGGCRCTTASRTPPMCRRRWRCAARRAWRSTCSRPRTS
jgi:KUP system potassium uptake protein